MVHERFFHAFVVSEDLEFFEHGHPSLVADGVFQYPITLPKAGVFRVLGDYYPAGATPQLTSDTIIVPGTPSAPVQLTRDYADKTAKNLRGSFSTIPEQAVATARTQMRLSIDAKAGLERYLGPWALMLRKQRSDRHDARAPAARRRRLADGIRGRLSAAGRLSRVDSTPKRQHREHGAL